MYLDDILNNKLKLHHKKKPQSIKRVIALIKTNTFDVSNKEHLKMLRVAQQHRYVDEDLNILRED